jgi:methanol---5-hydroxybenzimidazolylcobamide Co-methyltransferase
LPFNPQSAYKTPTSFGKATSTVSAIGYQQLALPTTDDLLFGVCPHPLTTRKGMVLGGGVVYPELNFTLPTMTVEPGTYPRVRSIYRDIIKGSLERAVQLATPGLQIEFETVPAMTEDPDFAAELVALLLEEMENAHAAHGLKSVLRMTPNDNREMVRPPRMRDGKDWDDMVRLFELSAAQGAELLSIESTGGKEVHDEALMNGDIAQSSSDCACWACATCNSCGNTSWRLPRGTTWWRRATPRAPLGTRRWPWRNNA